MKKKLEDFMLDDNKTIKDLERQLKEERNKNKLLMNALEVVYDEYKKLKG